ncbi:GtrA family protein [Bacillus sp. CGMCC 1.60114]|uniref:GtrA family protein n=1 Tax=unclassified Bacillus (in: firmicutes) TaxID=185979 RepID=UPI003634BFBA
MLNRLYNRKIVKYLFASIFAFIIDFSISMLCYYIFHYSYLVSSNIGVMISAVFHYILCTRYVFLTKTNSYTGSVYLLTFMMGIFFANSILWISYDVLHISFEYSKVISVGGSFFLNYSVRNVLFTNVEKWLKGKLQ